MDKIQNEVLDEAIEKGFWKDVLYEVISSMDPWDVDIVELSNRYLIKVREIRELSFRIPTNVLIVCSVLLRMKSEILRFEDDSAENGDECAIITGDSDSTEEQNDEINGLDFDIALIPRRVPKRSVTAEELISAIQSVLGSQPEKRRKISAGEPIIVETEEDIKETMEDVYNKICAILSKKEKVSFSEITDRENIVKTFISIIYLSNNQKLKLEQEKIYDEIYIKK